MTTVLPTAFLVADWRVDLRAGTLGRAGATVRVDDRALRVLARLAAQAGETVGIEALLDAAWPDAVVSPDSVYQAITTLRRALGDSAREPAFIATVPRRGYRLVAAVALEDASAPVSGPAPAEAGPRAPVEAVSEATPPPVAASSAEASSGPVSTSSPAFASPPAPASVEPVPVPVPMPASSRRAPRHRAVLLLGAAAAIVGVAWLAAGLAPRGQAIAAPVAAAASTTAPASASTPALPPLRSIAVLPFADLTDSMDKEPFADGLTEQLIVTFGDMPGVHVPSRTASFGFKGTTRPVAEVARALGVRYLLEGSVRQSGRTLRVTARLVRAGDGYLLWSQDYDRPAADLLKIQDDIAARVGAALRECWEATERGE